VRSEIGGVKPRGGGNRKHAQREKAHELRKERSTVFPGNCFNRTILREKDTVETNKLGGSTKLELARV
ncbi:hypothetical protein ALC60_12252, partial [Trachymyrmex zeteki]